MTLKKTDDIGPMTRRSFLERFGMVGGSALVMSAMHSWELLGAQAGPRPQLSGKPKNARVIVLGAGISGMTAGYELSKLGYDVKILEARDRVGGVNWSVRKGATHTELGAGGETQACTFDEGMYVNAGPWRIPHWHEGVLGYCKELGVPLEMFVNEAEASYFFYEGENIGPLSSKRVRLREVKADMIGYTCELMAKCVSQDKLDAPLTADDKERFIDFLVNEGYLDSADHGYRKNAGRGAGDPNDFRALLQSGFGLRIRSVMSGTGQAPMFQPIGGIDNFPKGFQRALGDKIQLRMEVQSIKQSATDVKVMVKNLKTGQISELVADYCISCLPLTVLAGMDVNLSAETMTAVKATQYSPTAKMGLQMKRRFWEEDDRIFGGHLYSNLPLGEFSYPSNGYFGQKGVLLGFYGNGRMQNLVDMPVKQRVEHVLTHASKVHPQIRTEFESGYAVFWEKVQYSLGAFSAGGGRGNANGNDRLSIIGRPDGRIYLGCAAVSGDGSWMEGAVGAAWKQVKALHQRAMTS
ncbi:MAG: flavin monoamine oxidase family protein [Vicinamibacterales bacterium]